MWCVDDLWVVRNVDRGIRGSRVAGRGKESWEQGERRGRDFDRDRIHHSRGHPRHPRCDGIEIAIAECFLRGIFTWSLLLTTPTIRPWSGTPTLRRGRIPFRPVDTTWSRCERARQVWGSSPG